MQPGSLHSRIFHLRKKAFQISQVVLFHHLVSSFFDLFYHLLVLSSLLMGLFRCDCPVSYLKDNAEKYHHVETTPKTEAGKRVIVLTHIGIETLKAHKLKQLEKRLAVGPLWNEHDLVLASSSGN